MERGHHLEITTIVGCKVGCSYCPQTLLTNEYKKVSDTRILSLNLYKKCLATVPNYVAIHFSGYAEPFLNPFCIDMIKFAHDKGHPVSVYSTLVGMTEDHVKELEKLTFVKFTIHLPDDRLHMKVKVDAAFLNVIKALLKSKIPNIRWFNFFGIHPEVSALIDENMLTMADLNSRAGNTKTTFIPVEVNHKGAIICKADRLASNVLLPNGDVTLCCMDYGRRHVIGNLIANKYSELHQSQAFTDVIDRMNGEPGDLLCRSCEWAEPIN
jgi:sulfatase maturation enzyme AslB (radical SAM superfamily)